MKIIDLDQAHRQAFVCCLEEGRPETEESGPRRDRWVERFLERGLRAKLALDDSGTVAGMIQYLPIEESIVEGTGLYFIPCIWVHGYEEGRGNYQGRGMGSALLEAAEEDARRLGATGMAAWGLWLPIWMKASWYRRHGYRKAGRQGLARLVWKPFVEEARPPRWVPRGKPPGSNGDETSVTVFTNGWCMAMNLVAERARRAAEELGEGVVYREIDTSEPGAVERWGHADAIFVGRKELRTGPPPSFEKVKETIARQMKP